MSEGFKFLDADVENQAEYLVNNAVMEHKAIQFLRGIEVDSQAHHPMMPICEE